MKPLLTASILFLFPILISNAEGAQPHLRLGKGRLLDKPIKMLRPKVMSAPAFPISISPNGLYLLTTDKFGLARVWRTNGRLLTTLPDIKEYIGFTSDSEHILSSDMEIVNLDGIRTGRLGIKPLKTDFNLPFSQTPAMSRLAISRDGKMLAYTENDGLLIHDIASDISTLLGSVPSKQTRLAFSATGKFLLSVSGHENCPSSQTSKAKPKGGNKPCEQIKIWPLPEGDLTAEFTEIDNSVTSAAISPDGKQLAYLDDRSHINFCDTASGKCATATLSPTSYADHLAWSPDGTILAGTGREAMLWNNDGTVKAISSLPDAGDGMVGDRAMPTKPVWSQDSRVFYSGALTRQYPTAENILVIDRDGAISARFGAIYNNAVISAVFSTDGNDILLSTRNRYLYRWDRYFALDRAINAEQDSSAILPSRNGSMIIQRKVRNRLHFSDWNGQELGTYEASSAHIAVSEDASLIGEMKDDYSLIINKRDGTGLAEYRPAKGNSADKNTQNNYMLATANPGLAADIAFSRDGGKVAWLVGGGNSFIIAPTVKSNRIKSVRMAQTAKILAWSMDGGRIIAAGEQGWQLFSPEGKFLTGKTTPSGVSAVATNSGGLLACGYDNGQIELYSPEGIFYKRGIPHGKGVNSLAFSRDGQYLLSGADDGAANLWNTATDKHVTIISSGSAGMVYTDDGYFDGTPDGGDLARISRDRYLFEVDKFAAERNRPDLLMERMNWGSAEAIAAFRQAYQKRLERSKQTQPKETGTNHLIVARIVPTIMTQSVPIVVQQDKINVGINCTSYRKVPLTEYRIYVNGVLTAREQAPSKLGFGTHTTVKLTPGENRIEASCVDSEGVESPRAITNASYNGPEKPSLYYVGFGVSKYRDRALDLDFAAKDAEDLGRALTEAKRTLSSVHVKTYLNEEVTTGAIHDARKFLENAKQTDILILFIAGHGLHDTDNDGTYYFLTHDADLKNLPGTAADFSLIDSLLAEAPQRRKLLLMDTCESGELDASEGRAMLAQAESAGLKARGMKLAAAKHLPARQSETARLLRQSRNRYFYYDFSRRSGALVFSSSRGGEPSFEDPIRANGIFTSGIKRALSGEADADHDGRISSDELQNFVSAAVIADSREKQHPVTDRSNVHQNFSIPVASGGQPAAKK